MSYIGVTACCRKLPELISITEILTSFFLKLLIKNCRKTIERDPNLKNPDIVKKNMMYLAAISTAGKTEGGRCLRRLRDTWKQLRRKKNYGEILQAS